MSPPHPQPDAHPPAVVARDLRFTYPARRRQPSRRALDGVSFAVPRGAIFGFLGPNGSGKTTLFRLLATLLPLPGDGGAVTVAGHDPTAEPLAVRRALGIAFQSPALDPRLTVEENLRHGGHLYGLSGTDLARRIDAGLARFSLRDRRRERVDTLSGGLRRQVELAKTLLHDPPVLLLDEPSTGLDPRARRRLWDLLAELAADGVTVLLTTHFIEEAERCDQLLLLDEGRVVAHGEPAALMREIGGEVVTLATDEPERLAGDVEAALAGLGVAGRATTQARSVRLELGTASGERSAWEVVAHLARRLPDWEGRVSAVTVARPTLEDVFLHRTGRPFVAADEAALDPTGSSSTDASSADASRSGQP